MLILRDLGVWSHYVADASNPMHTTIHSDGWGDYPNPNGYSTERGFHTRFEGAFVLANIEAEEVRQRVPEPVALRLRASWTASGPTSAPAMPQVIPLYELEQQDAFRGPEPTRRGVRRDQDGGRGCREIRDLVVMAWSASETIAVGFPPVTLADVLAARTRPSRSSGGGASRTEAPDGTGSRGRAAALRRRPSALAEPLDQRHRRRRVARLGAADHVEKDVAPAPSAAAAPPPRAPRAPRPPPRPARAVRPGVEAVRRDSRPARSSLRAHDPGVDEGRGDVGDLRDTPTVAGQTTATPCSRASATNSGVWKLACRTSTRVADRPAVDRFGSSARKRREVLGVEFLVSP